MTVQRDLNEAFTNYYKQIFGTRIKRRINVNWKDIYPNDVKGELLDLDKPFSEQEIWKAICDMPSDKAPGPDGFSVLFYKQFWEILKSDVIKLFDDFYSGDLCLGNFNFANVILIKKREGAKLLKDF